MLNRGDEKFYATPDNIKIYYETSKFGATYNQACAEIITRKNVPFDTLIGLGCGDSDAEWRLLHEVEHAVRYLGVDDSSSMRDETNRLFDNYSGYLGALNLDIFAAQSWACLRREVGSEARLVWTLLGGTLGNGKAKDLLVQFATQAENGILFADVNAALGVDAAFFRLTMRQEAAESQAFFQAPLVSAGYPKSAIVTRLEFKQDDLGLRCDYISSFVSDSSLPEQMSIFTIYQYDLEKLSNWIATNGLELISADKVPSVRDGVVLLQIRKSRGEG